tara:strand:+ start:330 stop:1193 length:864 start_codon:yes stop_codon:yes gene_type:complete
MKILFIGVFDSGFKSTNISQLLCFKKLGYNVVGYNYREKAIKIGNKQRDLDIIKTVKNHGFDLVVYSKCNGISYDTFMQVKKITKTCLWFMDPLVTYDSEMRTKTRLVDYFCCDKENVLEQALKINPKSYHVCEGYDQTVDFPRDLKKEHDVSFIGNIYGDREELLKQINHKVEIINNAYGANHSIAVSKTKINLNFCTSNGASDRVYRVLASGGFLISNDWKNRENYLTDGKDCVIFNDMEDLNKKIKYYLDNDTERLKIAASGKEAIKRFDRLNWAKRIVELSNE